MIRKFIVSIFIFISLSGLSAVKVGYALSGGGARGFAHIGMLKVMEENGIYPQYITGTSIGALIGGLYSIGYNASQIESLFVSTNWDYMYNDSWKREELYIGQKRWAPYGNAFFRMDKRWTPQLPQSVIVGNRINLELFRLFYPACGIQDFQQLPIPFSCVATDLVTGELTLFNSGSLMQGIRASMSIPSILQPFPLNNTLYIDGGISQNLPGKQVKELGAEYIIGFKVNSSIRKAEQLQGIIHVLDQTVNISITSKVKDELAYCDFILGPELSCFSATDFSDAKEIIRAGEDYAREHIEEIKNLAKLINSDNEINLVNPLPISGKVKFQKIIIVGNENISSAKIREYIGLETNHRYSLDEVIESIHRAWNSQLFDIIYPVIEPDGYETQLKVIVKERERKYLAVNLSYCNEDDFIAGAVLSLHNYFMRNSHLFAEIKVAGKHELNIDFVKNFGEAYGIYYRLFPYINEKNIYTYDDNHEIAASARSLEYGLTNGIGLFARKTIVLEAYGYTFCNRLYRNIADIDSVLENMNTISGFGFKAYHESLDDYTFPHKGLKALVKTSFARKDVFSEQTISKMYLDCKIYRPMLKHVSALLGIQYGSHFNNKHNTYIDPFYLGGINNFAGFPYYEKSAPFFKLIQAGIVINPIKPFFITTKLQALNYADNDDWVTENGIIYGGVMELGLKTYLGPLRLAIALSDNKLQYYFEFGYTNDIFHFSRR